MTQKQYKRAVEIYESLNNLEDVKKEIGDKEEHRLYYAYKVLRKIGVILDKHDLMIRQEIDDEIEKLKKEIETL